MDGLSSSSLGLQRFITPMDVALHAEHTAQQNAETVIKKAENSEKTLADPHDGDDNEGGSNYTAREDGEETGSSTDFEKKKANAKRYKVTFNQLTNMVELVDQQSGYVVETLAPDDLMGIVSKSGKSLGFLVDRAI